MISAYLILRNVMENFYYLLALSPFVHLTLFICGLSKFRSSLCLSVSLPGGLVAIVAYIFFIFRNSKGNPIHELIVLSLFLPTLPILIISSSASIFILYNDVAVGPSRYRSHLTSVVIPALVA